MGTDTCDFSEDRAMAKRSLSATSQVLEPVSVDEGKLSSLHSELEQDEGIVAKLSLLSRQSPRS